MKKMKKTGRLHAALILCAVCAMIFLCYAAGAAESAVGRCDDMESRSVGQRFSANQSPCDPYCSFGSYCADGVQITDKLAYSGEKSLMISGRYGTSSSLKVNSIFAEAPGRGDLGRSFKISFRIYPDKTAGVYKNSAEIRSAAVPFTAEELASAEGTRFGVMMAGNDDSMYKYRQGTEAILGEDGAFFARWNEWTEVSFYYTIDSRYMDNGKSSALSNNYVSAFRIHQNDIDFSVNEGLADTFYIDDLRVEEVGIRLDSDYGGSVLYVRNTILDRTLKAPFRLCILEYGSDGRLIAAGVHEIAGNKQEFTYIPQQENAPLTILLLNSDAANPTMLNKITAIPTPEGYGYISAARLEAYAAEMLHLSQAQYRDAVDYSGRLQKENAYIFAASDTTVTGKSVSGTAAQLKVNAQSESRLTFDISPVQESTVRRAYLRLFADEVTRSGTLHVTDAAGTAIGEADVHTAGIVYYIDITAALNRALGAREKSVSFTARAASGGAEAAFLSMETEKPSYLPCLILEGLGEAADAEAISSFDTSLFAEAMVGGQTFTEKNGRANWPPEKMTPTPTRTLDSLTDFTVGDAAPRVNQYGGWLEGGKFEATGFFRTELIDGRWWIIDPLGYKTLHIGISELEARRKSDIQTKAFDAQYKTESAWLSSIPDEMRAYGFNGAGPWSSYTKQLTQTDASAVPLVQAAYNDLNAFGAPYYDTKNNAFHVFDPSFEAYADYVAKTRIAPYADNPYILGWFTDNEPPANNDMLLAALRADKNNEKLLYTYYTAWAWLRERHGEKASISSVTAQDKTDWVEFVYDRYMQVCVNAIRKYDQNHMILGPKLDKPRQGCFRALSRHCDIIAYDYYRVWDADAAQIDQWYRWSGRPMINAEYYVKGMDACTPESELSNWSGVGYSVNTQSERGMYYQSFALTMLESRVFVGWQWFKYMDNDPTYMRDQPTHSNYDSNKGIITRDYRPYSELLSQMKKLNVNVYRLTEYFDTKN